MERMIQIDGAALALMAAAFARVNSSEAHTWTSDAGIDEIGKALQADISVYDFGYRGSKKRYIRFDFDGGSVEVQVGDQPAMVSNDNRPDDDGPPPGTPIAMVA